MISGLVVVDASVVVEYLVELRLAKQATRLFAGLIETGPDGLEMWAPDLVYGEVVSALRKLVRLKAIRPAAGERAIDQLVGLPIVATGTAALMGEAWKFARSMTVYDACYFVLARKLGAPFVTADERLARGLPRDSANVFSLSEFDRWSGLPRRA